MHSACFPFYLTAIACPELQVLEEPHFKVNNSSSRSSGEPSTTLGHELLPTPWFWTTLSRPWSNTTFQQTIPGRTTFTTRSRKVNNVSGWTCPPGIKRNLCPFYPTGILQLDYLGQKSSVQRQEVSNPAGQDNRHFKVHHVPLQVSLTADDNEKHAEISLWTTPVSYYTSNETLPILPREKREERRRRVNLANIHKLHSACRCHP